MDTTEVTCLTDLSKKLRDAEDRKYRGQAGEFSYYKYKDIDAVVNALDEFRRERGARGRVLAFRKGATGDVQGLSQEGQSASEGKCPICGHKAISTVIDFRYGTWDRLAMIGSCVSGHYFRFSIPIQTQVPTKSEEDSL